MKNKNGNASVACWYRRMNGIRAQFGVHHDMLRAIGDSQCDEKWPAPPYARERRDDEQPQFQFEWGLRLGDDHQIHYYLRVIDVLTKLAVPIDALPLSALERWFELKKALTEFLESDGDYPNPNHMPGGSQLER